MVYYINGAFAVLLFNKSDIPSDLIKYFEPVELNQTSSVLVVNTKPFPGAHFAVFPEALVKPMILAGTSPKACPHCQSPWISVWEKSTSFEGGSGKAGRTAEEVNAKGKWVGKQYGKNIKLGPVLKVQHTGWKPTCTCIDNDGSGKCLVLDPFCGSGTTCYVAAKLNRAYIGIDNNPIYCDMARERIGGDLFTRGGAEKISPILPDGDNVG